MYNFTIRKIDLNNENDLLFMFQARTHPIVCKNLIGFPPKNFESHKKWFFENVPSKRMYFIMKINDIYIGYCQTIFNDNKIEVGFVIHPEYHNKSFGSQLVLFMNNYLKLEFPDKKIILNVKNNNAIAIHIYEKFGFSKISEDGNLYTYELI